MFRLLKDTKPLKHDLKVKFFDVLLLTLFLFFHLSLQNWNWHIPVSNFNIEIRTKLAIAISHWSTPRSCLQSWHGGDTNKQAYKQTKWNEINNHRAHSPVQQSTCKWTMHKRMTWIIQWYNNRMDIMIMGWLWDDYRMITGWFWHGFSLIIGCFWDGYLKLLMIWQFLFCM